MRRTKLWLSALIVSLLAVLLFSGGVLAADTTNTQSTGTVYVSVEKFTLGKGYLMAPQAVSIADGETARDVLSRVLGTGNYQAKSDASYGWYLSAIKDSSMVKGSGNDISTIPAYIRYQDGLDLSDVGNQDGYLCEKDFTSESGWTYEVNNKWANVGFAGTQLQDGDVMRVAFTIFGYGNDWGNTGSINGANWPTYANLDAITKTLAKAKTAGKTDINEYTAAVSAASDLTSSQTTVDNANKALEAVLEAAPTPTPSPTATPSPSPTAAPTVSPSPTATPSPTAVTTPSVTYQTQIQNKGWEDAWAADGQTSGTVGQSLRLEAIRIKLAGSSVSGSIQYKTHIQNKGWESSWSADGAESGTVGQSLRLEAIQIQLTGDMAQKYDVYYRVQAQNVGWMGWAKNGESAGTAGYGYRLEAIQIELVAKGGAAPAGSGAAFQHPMVEYNTHVQDVGWQDMAMDGQTSGTVGQSKRLEAIHISLSNKDYAGSIQYRTHIQNIGWESSWSADGAMSGTSGQSLRLEAIQVQLTGDMAKNFDVYYRVHAQNIGWMGWAKNGESAGTAGFAYRLEGIQIELVAKGGAAPGDTASHFVQK